MPDREGIEVDILLDVDECARSADHPVENEPERLSQPGALAGAPPGHGWIGGGSSCLSPLLREVCPTADTPEVHG